LLQLKIVPFNGSPSRCCLLLPLFTSTHRGEESLVSIIALGFSQPPRASFPLLSTHEKCFLIDHCPFFSLSLTRHTNNNKKKLLHVGWFSAFSELLRSFALASPFVRRRRRRRRRLVCAGMDSFRVREKVLIFMCQPTLSVELTAADVGESIMQ
jgi:hypothetical protein